MIQAIPSHPSRDQGRLEGLAVPTIPITTWAAVDFPMRLPRLEILPGVWDVVPWDTSAPLSTS